MNHHYPPKPTRPGALFSYERNVREAIIRSRAGASAHARISDTTAGMFINPPPQPKAKGVASPEIRRLRIIAGPHGVNKGDYISCQYWDGETAEGSVNVAKPWLLRYSTLNGQTRGGESFAYETDALTRTVTHLTLTGDPESLEVLWPQYRPLDEIYAMRIPDGTGVMAGSEEVEWLDLNVDARTFVHPYQLAQVCVNGDDKSIVVRRGDVLE